MAMFKSVLTYLGLGPDEEYDDRYLGDDVGHGMDGGYIDDDYIDDDQPIDRAHNDRPSLERHPVDRGGPDRLGAERTTGTSVRATQPRQQAGRSNEPAPRTVSPATEPAQPSAVGAVRPLRSVSSDPQPNEREAGEITVRKLERDDDDGLRPVAMQRTKPRALSPQSFGDAKILADDFKRSIPVVMNLQGLDRELARRLIDFASGVCYSLGGSMEKMAPQVFLLTPRSVEVGDEDRRRIEERGFDR